MDGYYLNISEKAIKKCYLSCLICIIGGDEYVNNCLECNLNFRFINDFGYEGNCFEECPYYYFDDLNKFHCTSNISLIKYSIKQTKFELINNISNFLENLDPFKAYLLNGDDYSVIIKSLDENIEIPSNIIDFSECTKILKNKYPTQQFKIVQFNLENNNEKCLTNQVEYAIYNQFREEIDLSICENSKINIEYKIKNISSLDIEKIKYFRKKGIDIFQIESDFFNDICFPHSDEKSNSDMILIDRVKDIYQNFSLCEEGCEYEIFNLERMSVNCSCKIKQNIDPIVKKGSFKSYFASPFFNSNFGVIKCYKLFFSFNGKVKNVGFWVFLIMNIINFILYFFISLME